jgi:hypothetical protein
MNTFTSFDEIRIAYHDEGEGPPVFSCMEAMSMGSLSSETSTEFFPY